MSERTITIARRITGADLSQWHGTPELWELRIGDSVTLHGVCYVTGCRETGWIVVMFEANSRGKSLSAVSEPGNHVAVIRAEHLQGDESPEECSLRRTGFTILEA